MSTPLDELSTILGDNTGGYQIPLETAKKLEIKIKVDPKFKNVSQGKYVALIWNKNAFQWITFDDINTLTWNLSEPITKRKDAIDDQSAELLIQNGTFFKIFHSALILQRYGQFIKHYDDILQKHAEPLLKLQEAGQKINAMFQAPGMPFLALGKPTGLLQKLALTTNPLVAAENLGSVRDSAENLQNIVSASKDQGNDIKLDQNILVELTENAKVLQSDLEKSVDYDQASEHLSDYSMACADAEATSHILNELASDIEQTENKENKSILDQLWKKIANMWNMLQDKINDIIQRIGGFVKGVGAEIGISLNELKEAFGKGIDKIIEAFKKVAKHMHNLMSALLKQMFEFLNKFSQLAKANGWGVKEVEVKLPKLQLKFVNLVAISIPIPTIEPPDISIKFAPN